MTELRSDDRRDLDSQPVEQVGGSTGMLSYTLHIDGERHEIEGAWLAESLLFVLRERIHLRSTKVGCERGGCGACTVLVDGRPRYACLTLAAGATGSAIVTAEGLGADAERLRRMLVEHGAVQCGACTPGSVVAIHDLLARRTYPDEQDITGALTGISCSCGAIGRIVQAVEALVSDR